MKKGTVISLIVLLLLVGSWYYVHNYTRLMAKDRLYYTYYDNAKGLQASSPVYLKGVRVGKVKDIDLSRNQNIKVTFSLTKDISLRQGTTATIGAGDLTGNRAVNLIPSTNTAILPDGGFLNPGYDTTIIENFNAKITPIVHNGKVLLRTADEGLASFNKILLRGWGIQTQEDIQNVADRLDKIAKASGNANQGVQRLGNMVTRLDSATAHPEKKTANINKGLLSSEKKTAELRERPIRQDMEELSASIKKISSSISKAGQNKMLTDKKDYVDASNSLDTMNRSMKEYMADPPSPIKIFSSKKKK